MAASPSSSSYTDNPAPASFLPAPAAPESARMAAHDQVMFVTQETALAPARHCFDSRPLRHPPSDPSDLANYLPDSRSSSHFSTYEPDLINSIPVTVPDGNTV